MWCSQSMYCVSAPPRAPTLGAVRLSLPTCRQLPYLEAVVLETLRLRPPAYMVGRCASRPVILPAAQGDFQLPAGVPLAQQVGLLGCLINCRGVKPCGS